VRFGIVLFTSDRGIPPARAAYEAEARGFHTFYVPEHTHIPVKREAPHPGTGDASLPDDRYLRTLDPWVALAGAAAVTQRIELATAVALPVEHDPITLAKTIASLDHLSDGRLTLGCGFGWNTDELTDHGVPPGRRRAVLREYLEAMRALWGDEQAAYDGEFVRFGPSWAWPKPVRGSVPVLIGAGGTDKTFEWISRHADGWITTPRDDALVARVARLHEIWAAAGRTGLPRVVALGPRPDPEQLDRWAAGGITDVVYGLPDRTEDEVIRYLDRLVAKLEIVPATRSSQPGPSTSPDVGTPVPAVTRTCSTSAT
jgi:probable F420-dependent oxidoreductase